MQAVGNIIGDGLQERFHQLSEDQRAAMLWQETRADKRDCDVRAEAFEAAGRECAVLCNQNLGEDTAKKLRLTYEVRSEALSRKDYDDRYPDVGPAMPWTFYVNEALRRRGLTENDVFFEELMA